MMTDFDLTQFIKKTAIESGFDLVGIASALPHDHRHFLNQWLDKKFNATMEWMEKGRAKRNNPQLILENAKTFICLGLNYNTGQPLSVDSPSKDKGWISNYAWGEDYHKIIPKKIKQLEEAILKKNPNAKMKSYTDTGPILERSYANSAGLGWIGKNTCLINTKKGSYLFLAEILTDLDLVIDQPENDHCGKCTRCMDACPTDALSAYELNANKCISYLTIEHRGEIETELQKKMGHHLVGCDICQDVCPWNKHASFEENDFHFEFKPKENNFHPHLTDLKKIKPEDFSKRFENSPIKRLKWEGLQRNIKIVELNSK